MREYIKRFAYIFTITGLVLLAICAILKLARGADVSYLRLCLANAFTTSLVTLSRYIFRLRKGNPIAKTLLGFLVLLPIVGMFRRVFGTILFRSSLAIYLFSLIVAVLYSVGVAAISTTAKNQEKQLNSLVQRTTDEDKSDDPQS